MVPWHAIKAIGHGLFGLTVSVSWAGHPPALMKHPPFVAPPYLFIYAVDLLFKYALFMMFMH